MATKLIDFFKKNKIENLYTLHKTNPKKQGVYSLTNPVLVPQFPIKSFFETKPKVTLSPEQELSNSIMNGKSNSFTDSFSIK